MYVYARASTISTKKMAYHMGYLEERSKKHKRIKLEGRLIILGRHQTCRQLRLVCQGEDRGSENERSTVFQGLDEVNQAVRVASEVTTVQCSHMPGVSGFAEV